MHDRRRLSQSAREAILAKQENRCAECGKELVPGHYDWDHIQALEHDGDNELDNWRAICTSPCHHNKTRKDHQARAKRDRLSLGGSQRQGQPLAGTKASGFRKRMDGTVERR